MQSHYTPDWNQIATALKNSKKWRCEKCSIAHQNIAGKRIQVHHNNYDPTDNRVSNLTVVCPRCHLLFHVRQRGSITPGQLSLTI